MVLNSKFNIQDRVNIDGCKNIVGVVTCIEWRGDGTRVRYEVSWFHEGVVQFVVFDEWRLSEVKE